MVHEPPEVVALHLVAQLQMDDYQAPDCPSTGRSVGALLLLHAWLYRQENLQRLGHKTLKTLVYTCIQYNSFIMDKC